MKKTIRSLPYFAIVAFAALIRGWGLDARGFWLDEVMQVRASCAGGWRDVWRAVPIEKPPLTYFQIHWMAKASLADAWLRLPAFISGVVLVAAAMGIARALYGPKKTTVCLAGLLTAATPLAIRQSWELVPYSQAAALTALAWWAAIGCLKSPRAACVVGVWAAATGAFWTSLQSGAALAPLGAAMLAIAVFGFAQRRRVPAGNATLNDDACAPTSRRDARALWKCSGLTTLGLILAALSVVPFVWKFFAAKLVVPWGLPPFTLRFLYEWLATLSCAPERRGLEWIVGATAVLVALEAFRAARNAGRDPAPLLIPCWILGGLAMLYVPARIEHYWVPPRYLLFFVPPLAIMTASAIETLLAPIPRRRIRAAAAVVLGALFVASSFVSLRNGYGQFRDFRAVARFLAERAQPGDVAFFQHAYDEYIYAYYREFRVRAAPPSTFVQLAGPDRVNPNWRKELEGAKRIWAVETLCDIYPALPWTREYFTLSGRNPAPGEPIPCRLADPKELPRLE